jgi:hypothetical protein
MRSRNGPELAGLTIVLLGTNPQAEGPETSIFRLEFQDAPDRESAHGVVGINQSPRLRSSDRVDQNKAH